MTMRRRTRAGRSAEPSEAREYAARGYHYDAWGEEVRPDGQDGHYLARPLPDNTGAAG
jgi:hypothetical protein